MADSGPRYDVHVSGGKVGAVGDYATVFQIFTDSAPSLTSHIRAEQFRALVDDRTDGFVGRDFIFRRIDELLAGAEFDAGYVVILGEPGIGKSAIAATLVAGRGYVHHFNIAPENIRTARQFLENVCAQLIIRYELDYSSLPAAAGEDAGFLSQLLAEAAAKRGDLPIVVIVDALDEAEDVDLSPSANRLFLPRTLPAGVFFVLTSRDEYDYRLDVAEAEELWIREDDPENARDVTRFIEAFVDQRADEMIMRIAEWGVGRDEFVREIASLSEGNFMYLVHVLRDIARGRLTKDTVGAIDGLPRGLKRYYLRHWRDMKAANPDRFTTYQRPVLCFLAISREPVTVEQLAQWTQLEPGDVTGVIQEWREFLNPDGDRYRIYHRSFADFLDEEENLRYYHEQIVQSALAKIPGFLQSSGSD
jgi:hypothetical protein